MQYNPNIETLRVDLLISEAVLDLATDNETAINIGLVSGNRKYQIVDQDSEKSKIIKEFINKINSSIRDPKYKKILTSKLLFAHKYASIDLINNGEEKIIIANISGENKFSLIAHLMKDSIYIKTTDESNNKSIADSIMLSSKPLDEDTKYGIIRTKETSRKFMKDNKLLEEKERIDSYVKCDKNDKVSQENRESKTKLILKDSGTILENNEVFNIKWRCKANEAYILGYAKEGINARAYYYIAPNDCPSLVNLDCTNSRCIIPESDVESYNTGKLDVVEKYKDYEKEYTFGFIKSMIPDKKDDSN